MFEDLNRAQRRARARAEGGRRQRLKKGVVALGAIAALGAGTVMGPAGIAQAETSTSIDLAGMDFGAILGMLDDPMVSQFVEMCRTGALSTGPDSSKSTEFDVDNPPLAVADCSTSTGTGIALVLPERLEVGQAAENMEMDLGDDINLLFIKYKMGERNLFEILSGVTLGSDTIKGAAELLGMPRVDPGAFDKYKSYAEVQRDAALPVVMERYCKGVIVFGNCVGGWAERDTNLTKRSEALTLAEYLTGHTYDHSVPQNLPGPAKPIGTSTIAGEGINVALSMRGGNASATTGHQFAAALAGADRGRQSTASATLGIATAMNMNTDDIKFTWFGQEVDFSKLLAAGLLDSSMAGEAGADATEMLEMIGGINGNIPQLKEVSCFGVNTSATAEGLGSCTNILGTFDTYKDLRPVTDGGHRQEQYGLTDVTSLFLGNDALLKQLGPALGGDTSGLMNSPFVADMLKAMISEDDRIKFAKDFIRYTKDVETTFAKTPKLDANGNPVLDAHGNPVMEVTTTPRMVGATEVIDEQYQKPVTVQEKDADGNLLWVDGKGSPVEAGAEGALPKMVQDTNADGTPKTAPATRKVTKPVMIWVDADGNEVTEGTEGAQQVQKRVQAKDYDGNLIFDPVIEKTTTAHWLTSDYGLREPLVIQWLGHEIVFFPPVEINGSTRPNLIGLPQIKKITDDAQTGLLPKISLVQWDNAFGLGTMTLDNPFDPISTFRNMFDTVTVFDDLKAAGDLIGQLTAQPDAPTNPADPNADESVNRGETADMVVNSPAPDLPDAVVNEAPELAPIEVITPDQADPVDVPEESPAVEAPAPETPAEEAPADEAPTAEESAPVDAPSAVEPEIEPAL